MFESVLLSNILYCITLYYIVNILYADDNLYFPLQHKSKEFLGPLLDFLN